MLGREMRQKVEYVLENPFAGWPDLTFYPLGVGVRRG
jgi:hypothetical protein